MKKTRGSGLRNKKRCFLYWNMLFLCRYERSGENLNDHWMMMNGDFFRKEIIAALACEVDVSHRNRTPLHQEREAPGLNAQASPAKSFPSNRVTVSCRIAASRFFFFRITVCKDQQNTLLLFPKKRSRKVSVQHLFLYAWTGRNCNNHWVD